MKDKYITGILNKYVGMRDIAVADLSVYIDNPVGIGEHSNIGEEIEKKIKAIDEYNSLIETITKYFSTTTPDQEQASDEE